MNIEVEEYPCTTPVVWRVILSSARCKGLTIMHPVTEGLCTKSSEDCLLALVEASSWINLGRSEIEKLQWVVNNAPEWLTVEVIDERNS